MNHNLTRRAHLLLLELMTAILFFCLCSAVCVRLFVKAHLISEATKNLSMASNQVTTFAELFRQTDDLLPYLEEHYPDGILSPDNGEFLLYYDKDWDPCKKGDESFILTIQTMPSATAPTIQNGTFIMNEQESGEELYRIETKKYRGGGTGE